MTVIWQPGMTLEQLEKKAILAAFRHYGGNQTATAQALGISVRTIRNKLVSYGMKGIETDEGSGSVGDSGPGSNGGGPEPRNGSTESRNDSSGTQSAKQENATGAKALGLHVQDGLGSEPATQVPEKHAVPLRETRRSDGQDKEVQELLSKPIAAGNTKGRR